MVSLMESWMVKLLVILKALAMDSLMVLEMEIEKGWLLELLMERLMAHLLVG